MLKNLNYERMTKGALIKRCRFLETEWQLSHESVETLTHTMETLRRYGTRRGIPPVSKNRGAVDGISLKHAAKDTRPVAILGSAIAAWPILQYFMDWVRTSQSGISPIFSAKDWDELMLYLLIAASLVIGHFIIALTFKALQKFP